VCVLMLTTAGTNFSTRSAKSGSVWTDDAGTGVEAGAMAGRASATTARAPRREACKRFMNRFLGCVPLIGGKAEKISSSSGPAGDAAPHLLRGGQRHLAQHRDEVLPHRPHEEGGRAVLP